MAVLVEQRLPATTEVYDAVNERMGVAGDMPPGLLFHAAVPESDGLRVIDVWESEGAWGSFREERLQPAVGAVLEEHGIEPDGPPDVTVSEIHNTLSP